MRGKIDLGEHKLAGLTHISARRRNRLRRGAMFMPKMPGGNKGIYFILWRLVDGAVEDTFRRHPDYLTKKGRESARLSINKRVVGVLMGYATQVAQSRSAQTEGPKSDAAAESVATQETWDAGTWFVRIMSWVRACGASTCGDAAKASPEIHGDADG